MKTPTLIVRLAGLYLAVASVLTLVQVHKITSLPGGTVAENPMLGDMTLYTSVGLIVGVVAASFAGPLARLLTFDSEPREKARDLSDSLLGRKP
jgi:hypothetical protein